MTELDLLTNKGVIRGSLLSEVREYFSEKNEAAKFLKRRFRFIPQRKYAITPAGRFQPGLFIEIKNFLTKNHPEEKIRISNELINTVIPGNKWKNDANFEKNILPLNLDLYDYQKDIVERCIDIGRGTVVLATAGGKTLITSSLINHLRKTIFKNKPQFKCMMIVPSLSLVDQTIDKFKEYGVNFTYSKWTGKNERNLTTDVIVCNIGILQSKNTDLTFIEDIDLLIIDEVHVLRHGNNFNKIVDKVKTIHKFGFTGTLPESNIDKWNILGKIGPILYERKSYELRKDNFVSNAQISILQIFYNKKPQQVLNVADKYRAELEYLITNDFRNKIISKISSNSNNNILIMVDYIRHGERLYETLTTNNPRNKEIYFIQGKVETDVREKIRKKMEYKDNVVCIAISKIFSTGIDIKNLHNIVFAGGGKAKIKIIQSIGRGLRLHKDKKLLQIIDLQDQLYYSIDHGNKRIKFYEQEKIPFQKTEIRE
jgi:superfamily II DNA or RNA helicase